MTDGFWTGVGYVPPGGTKFVRVHPRRGATKPTPGFPPTVTLSAVTSGRVSTVTAVILGENADHAGATWNVSAPTAAYSSTVLKGPKAVFRHTSDDTVTVTVTVPRTDGGPAVTATIAVTPGGMYVPDIFKRAWTRGGETMPIEASFGFTTAGTRRARLVRTASPGVPSERTVIAERDATFEANKAVVLREELTFTAPAGTKGHGHEYVWEVDTSPATKVQSRLLPMWVYGASTPVQSLDAAPATVNYPPIYTRHATDSGTVTPAAGLTYQQHVDKFVYDWKANNLSSPVGGAWLSFNDYNSNLVWVDLDDPTIPRYTIKHWDMWEWGYTKSGWYGDDPWAKPYPRSRVAVDVPIPDHAVTSPGTDQSIAIVGMRGGKVETIWEFWKAEKLADGSWRAASIGRTTAADDWRHSASYTAAASGISALAYALRVKEAQTAVNYVRAERAAGRVPSETEIIRMIPHALAINIPDPRAGKISYPATYTDGSSSNPATAWEGQLVYLRQDADLVAANLTPLKHVIAVVGKHRGFRVTDRTSWSTTMIVEGDQSYGGGLWETIRDPGETFKVVFPDSWFVVGRQYETKEAFDADTTSLTVTAREDAPGEVLVSWTPAVSATVSRDGVDRDGTVGWTDTGTGSYRFTKLLPGTAYTFTVSTSEQTKTATLTTAAAVNPTPVGVLGDWSLTWSDEFDGTNLDTTVWTPLRGLPGGTYDTPFNQDMDRLGFKADRTSVTGGNLRLAWDRTEVTTMWGRKFPWTGGMVHSGAGWSFTYGYLEARIYLSKTTTGGLWPAFWLLSTPVDRDWPPEVDIAEWVTKDTPDGLYHPHFNVHWKDAAGVNRQAWWQSYGAAGKDFTGGWHTYGVLWEPGRVQVYLDGVAGPSYEGEGVPDRPMYVVLSTGVGEAAMGDPTPDHGEMLVDYVRHWRPALTST